MSINKSLNYYSDSFLHNLKNLIKEIYYLSSNDPNIYRANKRINLLIELNPSVVIEVVGEKLFSYKDFIYNEDKESSLLGLTFSSELEKVSNIDNANLANLLIYEIKQIFVKLTKQQKILFRKNVCDLLDDYLEYECIKNQV